MTPDLHQQALTAFSADNFEEALGLLEQALADQQTSELWNDWASAQFRLHRWREASEGFRRAIELDVNNQTAMTNLVALLEEFGRHDERQKWESNRDLLIEALAKVRSGSKSRSMGKNLVIGLAVSYGVNQIAPFVVSLRRTGFKGDIVLFVSSVDDELKRFADEHDVTFKYWGGSFLAFDIMLARLFIYYDYLAELDLNGRSYDWVLLTDVRDVFFQRDPFGESPYDDLLVFLEDPSRCLDSCPYNASWIQAAFGAEVLKSLAKERISCAGTVMGSWEGILQYLLCMQLLAMDRTPDARLVKAVDQGIHNVLIHHKVLPAMRLVENGDRVFTMQYVSEAGYKITDKGEIFDPAGRVPAVIHQYDRHPALLDLVKEKFAPETAMRT